MSKVNFNKIKLALVAVLFAIVYVCVGTMMFAKADETLSDASGVTTFEMSGAELIIEGEDGVNGLKFTASISEKEYNALKAVDADFETGVVILPSHYDLGDAENELFGENAIYDWAIWNGSDYVYTESGKDRVVNINANDWVDAGDTMTYSGAIVDIQDHNETVAFTSIAYIKVVDAGEVTTFAWTDKLDASIAIEVEKAYAGMTDDQKAWVDANWTKIVAAEADTVLIDIAGKEEISFVELLDADIMEELDVMLGEIQGTATLTKGEVVIDLAGNIAVADLSEGVWTIELKADGVLVYAGLVDIYNSTKPVVWNTIDEEGLAYFEGYYPDKTVLVKAPTLKASISSVGDVKTIAVTEIKKYVDAPGEAFFSLKPVHSKAYYEKYVGKGVIMDLGMYFETEITPADKKYIVNHGAVGFNNGVISVPKANTWHTATITLDTIVENWDSIVEGKGVYTWDTRDDITFFYALMTDYKPSEDLIYHFTGFNLSMDVSALATNAGEILVKLDDVDKKALDLTSYMKKEDAEMIDFVASVTGVTYEMKGYSIDDTIAVTDLTKVDVSNAEEAAYFLTAKVGDTALYTAVIDLYSSSSPVVWADTLTAKNVLIHSGGYTTGRATPATAKEFEIIDASTVTEESDPLFGKTGTFAKTVSTASENVVVSVLSLHSKAYYKEMVGNKDYVLTIDKYVAGSYNKDTNPGGSMLSGMGMQGATNYGRWNTWSNYRGGDGTLNKWGEKAGIGLYMSLDNYLLRSEDDPCYYTGAWYDFYNVHSKASKNYNMMQFEVKVATPEDPITIYISGAKIVNASETLLSASNLATTTSSTEYQNLTLEYDFANEKKVDLTTVFDANNLAKYKVYADKYVGNSNFKWTITFSDNTTVIVNPSKDGTTELDLSALASDGATVYSKLVANAKIKVVAIAPSQPYPQPTNIAIFNATVTNLPAHVCDFADTYTYDETDHWFACEGETCTEIKDKAAHEFVEGVCVCGAKDPNYVPPHVCEFSETYSSDADNHWFACKDATCTEVSGKAAHAFVEGVCVCGYKDPTYVPEEPEKPFDIADYAGKYSETEDLIATPGALFTSAFTPEMLADFATLEANGYELTYLVRDTANFGEQEFLSSAQIAELTLTSTEYEVIVVAGADEVEILYAYVIVE